MSVPPDRRESDHREIEVKIEVRDLAEIRERLAALGARAQGERLFEDNRLYDDRTRSLERSRKLLRLRRYGDEHLLTVKTPVAEDAGAVSAGGHSEVYKVRKEYETRVEDPQQVDLMLHALGYLVTYRYQKYRQVYHLGRLSIEVDETPIGSFIEIEGSPGEIDDTARKLGFGKQDYITKTYRQLHRERASADPPGDMVFPNAT